MISIAPLSTVLLSAVVLHEKIRSRLWLGLGLAVAGSVVISSPDLSLAGGTLAGPLLVVLAAVASATFTVTSKPLVGKYGPFPVAAWAAFLGTAMLLPLLSGSLVGQAASLSSAGWASVLYLTILSTIAANLIFFTLVSRQEVSRLGIQLYLVPVVSAVGGVLILGEALGVSTLVGGGLLLVAIGLATSGHR
jgi:drug/metabolite transporter (DMT)-like permease